MYHFVGTLVVLLKKGFEASLSITKRCNMRATILCLLLATPATSFVPQVNRFSQRGLSHALKTRQVTLASSPAPESDAIMSDDPMIVRLEEECARINGINWNSDVGLMQLLNPSKVRV